MVPVTLGNVVLFVLSLGRSCCVLSPLLTLVDRSPSRPRCGSSRSPRGASCSRRPGTRSSRPADVAGMVDEAVTGVRVVKGFGQEEQELERLEAASSGCSPSRLRAIRLTRPVQPRAARRSRRSARSACSRSAAGWPSTARSRSARSWRSPPTWPSSSARCACSPAWSPSGQQARAGVDRVFDLIDSRPDDRRQARRDRAAAGRARTVELRRRQVRLRADASRCCAACRLRVDAGRDASPSSAPSGSGKSTVALLLPRFYDVAGGAVRVGGHDVARR